MKPEIMKTKYYGIWLQYELGHWWIVDADGYDEYYGDYRPSDWHITQYRNRRWV